MTSAGALLLVLAVGLAAGVRAQWSTLTRSVANATEVVEDARRTGGAAEAPGRLWPALLAAGANYARSVAATCADAAPSAHAAPHAAGHACVSRGWVQRNALAGPALVRLSDQGTSRQMLQSYSPRDVGRFSKDVVALSRATQRLAREANAFVRAETEWTRTVVSGLEALVEADEARAACTRAGELGHATAQGIWKAAQRAARRVDEARAEADVAAADLTQLTDMMQTRLRVMLQREGVDVATLQSSSAAQHVAALALLHLGPVDDFAHFSRRTSAQRASLVRSLLACIGQIANAAPPSTCASSAPPSTSLVPPDTWENLTLLDTPLPTSPISSAAALRNVLRVLIEQ
jgi:hypothetical protein